MSHELHHFDMGLWVFFLAYATAVCGSFVGLSCARRSVVVGGATGDATPGGAPTGVRWIAMAALAIGGVGIWLMHFIGMMGFAVPGSKIRYALGPTLFSVVVAVGATFLGFWMTDRNTVLGRRLPRAVTIPLGGLVMGLAVTLMHYSGMAAIRIQGTIAHDPAFVAGSVVIGVVASTAALWLAGVTERIVVRVGAACVMGCAVVSLHYTGMAGVHVTVDSTAPIPVGPTVTSLLFPAFVIGILVLILPIVALLLEPATDGDRPRQRVSVGRRGRGAERDRGTAHHRGSADAGAVFPPAPDARSGSSAAAQALRNQGVSLRDPEIRVIPRH